VVSDEPTMAKLVVNFVVGTVGAVFGAGTVYGTTKMRLSALETRMKALEERQQADTSEIHQEISALRTEIREDLRDLKDDIKSYIRDLVAAHAARGAA
jgi:BMFP domain-containing protein YqiC